MGKTQGAHAARLTTMLAAATLVAACGNKKAPVAPIAPAAQVAPAVQAEWPRFVERYEDDSFAANPVMAVSQGRHEYDGRLPDWSAQGLQAEVDRLLAAQARAQAFDAAQLSAQQRFEREYLLASITGALFWLRDAETPYRNPGYYAGMLDPSTYLTRPYADIDVRMKAFIAYARALPAAAAQIRANLRTPMPKTFITLGINSFGGYPDFFRSEVPKVFADVQDEALQAELKTAIDGAAKAMQGLADWLRSEQPKGTDDFALGPQKFAKMLYDTERVTTPLARLEAVGRADLARNLASLRDACAKLLPDATIKACVDQVNADKPEGGAVDGARAQLDELRQFVIDKKLVSIPSDEKARVAEAPPYQRWNFAYIDIPGPYDKGMPSTYYIAPPDPAWPKKERDDYTPGRTVLLFTSAHEVWPGHFLQFLHSNRSPSRFGQLFVGYAFAEGWAHYAEEMMWDAGLGDGKAEYHIGQLSEALLRDVRLVCAIGLHTQGMSVDTCEKMFREEGIQDAGNARQQAARGTYDPAYLNYTMGKLMIMKLREDWTATRGGREAWHDFHDQFLSYGGPPIPLVREQMLGRADGELF